MATYYLAVQEPRLACELDRLGLIKRRNRHDTTLRSQPGYGVAKVVLAVSDVRSKRKIDQVGHLEVLFSCTLRNY